MPRKSSRRRKGGRATSDNPGALWRLHGAAAAVNRSVGVADKQFLRLKYFEFFNMAGAISVDRVFNMNSLFDPDQSGGGHQPLEFDQWEAMYNRYLVRRFRARVTFCQDSSTSNTVCGIAPMNNQVSAFSPTQMRAALESPLAKATTFSLSPGQPSKELSISVDLAKLTGVTPQKYESDDVYQAVVGASPSELMGFHVFAFDIGLGSNVNIGFTIQIEFECAMFDRTNVSSSSSTGAVTDEKYQKYQEWKLGGDTVSVGHGKGTSSSSSSDWVAISDQKVPAKV